MSIVSDLLSGGISGILDGASNVIEKFVPDPDKKIEMQQELAKLSLEGEKLEFELEKEIFKDRASARDMYQNDSSLQKIFAMVFLCGYLALTGFILFFIFGKVAGNEMENWKVSLITAIFTAMSTKVNTICDFLFGGSQSGDDSAKKIGKLMEDKGLNK